MSVTVDVFLLLLGVCGDFVGPLKFGLFSMTSSNSAISLSSLKCLRISVVYTGVQVTEKLFWMEEATLAATFHLEADCIRVIMIPTELIHPD